MQFEKIVDVDVRKGRAAEVDLGPVLFAGDSNSMRLGVRLFGASGPVEVTGTVSAWAIVSTGQTLDPFESVGKSENTAWVDIPQDALIPGRIEVFLRLTDDDEYAVTLHATATVRRTQTGEIIVPGDPLPNVDQLREIAQDCIDATEAASNAVSYTAQTPTDAQQAQARTNIGAAGAEEADALGVAKTLELTWAQGTINGTAGANASSSTRIRTNEYYRMDEDTVVVLGLADGYDASLRDYTTNGTSGFVSSIPTGVWAWDGFRVAIPAGHYLRFVARKNDDAAIVPADGANITVTLLTGGAANLAPAEGATASATYAAGDLLMRGGQLKQATQAIAAGETIDSTNTEDTTVAEQLAAEATAREAAVAEEASAREEAVDKAYVSPGAYLAGLMGADGTATVNAKKVTVSGNHVRMEGVGSASTYAIINVIGTVGGVGGSYSAALVKGLITDGKCLTLSGLEWNDGAAVLRIAGDKVSERETPQSWQVAFGLYTYDAEADTLTAGYHGYSAHIADNGRFIRDHALTAEFMATAKANGNLALIVYGKTNSQNSGNSIDLRWEIVPA